MTQNQIGIIASDMRQIYMEQMLCDRGYRTLLWDMRGEEDEREPENFWQCSRYILPVPVSRMRHPDRVVEGLESRADDIETCFGGAFPGEMRERLERAGIAVTDVLKDPRVALRNAVATAEGTVAELLALMPVNMEGAHIMVLGFGKCGRLIAEKLYCMGAYVSVAIRSEKARQMAGLYGFQTHDIQKEIPFAKIDAVVNTVPAMVMDRERLDCLPDGCVVVDIASAPGGCDGAYCREKQIPYKLALGLPGRYAPKTSAEILLDAMPFS